MSVKFELITADDDVTFLKNISLDFKKISKDPKNNPTLKYFN